MMAGIQQYQHNLSEENGARLGQKPDVLGTIRRYEDGTCGGNVAGAIALLL